MGADPSLHDEGVRHHEAPGLEDDAGRQHREPEGPTDADQAAHYQDEREADPEADERSDHHGEGRQIILRFADGGEQVRELTRSTKLIAV